MEARKMPAAHGWLWIKQAFELFRKSPLIWMVLVAIAVVGTALLAFIPVIGGLLSNILMPVLLGGFMLGARDLDRGSELELKHLSAGLRSSAQGLVTLGGINVVAQLLIIGLMGLLGGGSLVGLMMSGKRVEDPALIAHALTGAGLAMLVGLALFSLVLMAMQFAPMLVVFEHLAPIQALKTSLRAFLRNMIPLTIYGLVLLPFAIIASIFPLGLGWLVLMPIIVASLYTIYVDLFPLQGGEPQTIEGEVISGDDSPQS